MSADLTGDAAPVVTESDLAMATTPEPAAGPRRIVFVAGSGRSGTSLMSGILKHLGLHVPEPEVVADTTNPKGFGEPQWVVDFHEQLLRRANVAGSDARPDAWFDAGRVGLQETHRAALSTWLEEQFAVSDALVIKDPRLAWFLAMWRGGGGGGRGPTPAIPRLGAPPGGGGGQKAPHPGAGGGATAAGSATSAGWPAG